MSDRYFAKVVKIVDEYTVVLNVGSDKGLRVGKVFLIVGIGEMIRDPETGEELGQLEIVRGKAKVTHVQDKISTLASAEIERQPDIKEIKKVSSTRGSPLISIMGPQETVTESTRTGEPKVKALTGVAVGDYAIEA